MIRSEIVEKVAILTLSHPPVNALSRSFASAIFDAIRELAAKQWSVLHIRSDQRVFSAGADIKLFAERLNDPRAGDILAEEAEYYQQLFLFIENLPQPSLAEIDGAAVGGGLELALACDLRIASQSAKIGLPEAGLGLLPAGGGTQRLTRLCGRATALRLIAGAELVSGCEAHRIGLVQWVVAPEVLSDNAAQITRTLASQPYPALVTAKSCISAYADRTRNGFAEELQAPKRLMQHYETHKRILAFLNRKR